MPGETIAWGQKRALDWTPYLIKRLRGKRTQTEFGALLGDLESARADVAKLFHTSLERTSRQLVE